ncbi:MAG: LLM class flavin-dependent oxidoreductase [Streptosporangiales bacterium]|nr:LLM class flavin-dependent oxidoreductase [Streptosporangiales bacterium]
MKIGIGIPNQVRDVRPEVIPEWARLAEESGFSSLTTVGRYAYPGVSETVALAGAAAVTRRIELISGVLLAATWPGALLAKELAGIDGISGGRLSVGIGSGQRPDDFVADGHGPAGRGARLDRDLETYRGIWRGDAAGGGPNPAVPAGTRQIPLLFGGFAPAVMDRMARWGQGYIGASVPAPMAAPAFGAAREAWARAGRDGAPRLIALAYFALGDGETGRRNVQDYYSVAPDLAGVVAGAVCDTPAKVKEAVASFTDLGVDEISFNTGTDDLDEVRRLADIVF